MTWLRVGRNEKGVKLGDAWRCHHELAGRIFLVHLAHGAPTCATAEKFFGF
jgi:hypothetical protein